MVRRKEEKSGVDFLFSRVVVPETNVGQRKKTELLCGRVVTRGRAWRKRERERMEWQGKPSVGWSLKNKTKEGRRDNKEVEIETKEMKEKNR